MKKAKNTKKLHGGGPIGPEGKRGGDSVTPSYDGNGFVGRTSEGWFGPISPTEDGALNTAQAVAGNEANYRESKKNESKNKKKGK